MKSRRIVKNTVRIIPEIGLRLTYRLIFDAPLYRVELTARNAAGTRRETSGALEDRETAEAFYAHLVTAAVTPYTLLAIYDEFFAARLTESCKAPPRGTEVNVAEVP